MWPSSSLQLQAIARWVCLFERICPAVRRQVCQRRSSRDTGSRPFPCVAKITISYSRSAALDPSAVVPLCSQKAGPCPHPDLTEIAQNRLSEPNLPDRRRRGRLRWQVPISASQSNEQSVSPTCIPHRGPGLTFREIYQDQTWSPPRPRHMLQGVGHQREVRLLIRITWPFEGCHKAISGLPQHLQRIVRPPSQRHDRPYWSSVDHPRGPINISLFDLLVEIENCLQFRAFYGLGNEPRHENEIKRATADNLTDNLIGNMDVAAFGVAGLWWVHAIPSDDGVRCSVRDERRKSAKDRAPSCYPDGRVHTRSNPSFKLADRGRSSLRRRAPGSPP
jgi:hypothetical protein